MGFDLVTVDGAPRGLFGKHTRDGKSGYFRHGGGVIKVLFLMGVDVQTPKPRLCGFQDHEDQPPILSPLIQAMSYNDGMQVTPEECSDIAMLITAEKVQEHVVGQPRWDGFPAAGNYEEDDVAFFVDFAKFCRKARDYGGFYVY
jgi:hypothetical protein